jgi:hypothetical protein
MSARVEYARPLDLRWIYLDLLRDDTPERRYGPFPTGTRVRWRVLIAGAPQSDWSAELRIAQGGETLACSRPPVGGLTNDDGAAVRVDETVLA